MYSLFACVLLLWAGASTAQSAPARTDSSVSISLEDGTRLEGTLVSEDETSLIITIENGLEIKVPRKNIATIRPLNNKPRPTFSNPDNTRLIFAPTARPLRRYSGYFSDYYVFFPGISYGLSDHLGLTAGLSILPGIAIDEQLFTIAPKVTLYSTRKSAIAIGTLHGFNPGEGAAGIAFAVATRGDNRRSLTLGLGLGYARESGESTNFAEHLILLIGGHKRLSPNLSLVSENWLIGGDVGLAEQPFALALRFSGQNLSTDLGIILIGEILKEGFPIPSLSFAYRFGH
jgi:hypothetical protein